MQPPSPQAVSPCRIPQTQPTRAMPLHPPRSLATTTLNRNLRVISHPTSLRTRIPPPLHAPPLTLTEENSTGQVMTRESDRLLVLDVDETLICSSLFTGERPPDFKESLANVWKRAGAEGFLAWCLERFRVGVWTAATKSYVAEVLDHLVSDFHTFAFIYAGERCSRDEVSVQPRGSAASHSGDVPKSAAREKVLVKDMGILLSQGCRAEQIIVVDGSPESWGGATGTMLHRAERSTELAARGSVIRTWGSRPHFARSFEISLACNGSDVVSVLCVR